MKCHARLSPPVVALAATLLLPLAAVTASARPPVILSAGADFEAMTIAVRGRDFGDRIGAVRLGAYPPLPIESWSTGQIVAQLPPAIEPGSYLLVVKVPNRLLPVALFAVTLGAEGPQGIQGPQGDPGKDADVSQFYTKSEIDALLLGIQPTLQNGDACGSDRPCLSGNCVDGVCCDLPCAGNCRSCALAGSVGTCTAVPNGQDPRKACQASEGGAPGCAGACFSGRCSYPDVGTRCGLCASCDGTGRCTATPADDADCGTVACGGLDTFCRIYQDLTASRCAGLGLCKGANDPATCTLYQDILPCCGNSFCEGGENAANCPADCN